ncbi:MAG: hypothetical protein ACTSQE_12570 [Candidatus Heimdallarchaeaceae archaeon]
MNKQPNTEEEFFGTEGQDPIKQPGNDEPGTVDYKEKFINSSKGAQDLLEKNKFLQAELDAQKEANDKSNNQVDEPLYPGFENLSEMEQQNMRNYTDGIIKTVKSSLSDDPVYAESRGRYNELKWDESFNRVASAYPELMESKEDFKAKNFQAHNVPDNIDGLLTTLAKDFLFDKARDIGIREGKDLNDRIDPIRNTGGSGGEGQATVLNKTLAEWQHLAATDPAEFANQSQQYDEDVATGKLD